MVRTTCMVIAAFSAMTLSACADRAQPTTSAVTTIDTVAGVELVHNTGAPPSWLLEEIFTLGSAGGSELAADDEFGRISGVLADESGNVYVADANAAEIRVFEDGGAFVGRIGRKGSGPAEYQQLQSIGWLGDTLAVLDPGNARLGLFLRTGEWLDHRPYMALSGSGIRLYSTGLGELYMPFIMRSASRSGLVYVQQTRSGPGDTISSDVAPPGSAALDELRERQRGVYVTCRHSGGRGISSYSATLAPPGDRGASAGPVAGRGLEQPVPYFLLERGRRYRPGSRPRPACANDRGRGLAHGGREVPGVPRYLYG